jgi:hypothetical protein
MRQFWTVFWAFGLALRLLEPIGWRAFRYRRTWILLGLLGLACAITFHAAHVIDTTSDPNILFRARVRLVPGLVVILWLYIKMTRTYDLPTAEEENALPKVREFMESLAMTRPLPTDGLSLTKLRADLMAARRLAIRGRGSLTERSAILSRLSERIGQVNRGLRAARGARAGAIS